MTNRTRKTKSADKAPAQPPSLIAYHVTERGEKNFWTRIGAAWDHVDAKGMTLELELMPTSGGRIVLREPSEPEVIEEEESA